MQEDGSLESLLSELCLTRCNTCNEGSTENKKIQNRIKNSNRLIADSQLKTNDDEISYEISSSIFEPYTSNATLFQEVESSSKEFDSSTNSLLSIDSNQSLKESIQILNENSIRTETWRNNNFEKKSNSFLLKDRCKSSECGCVKTFSGVELGTVCSKSINSCRQTLQDLSTLTCESAAGLRLIDSNGEVEVLENSTPRFLTPSVRSTLSARSSKPTLLSARKSSFSAISLLNEYFRITSNKNFSSDLSDKSEAMCEFSQDFPCSSESTSRHKSQKITSAYGRFLHKIDKLKKITSWKSRKRKSKIKMPICLPSQRQECPQESRNVNLSKYVTTSVCTSGLIEKDDKCSQTNVKIVRVPEKCNTLGPMISEEGSENIDTCMVESKSIKSCYAAIGNKRSPTDTQRADKYTKSNSNHVLRNVNNNESFGGSGDHNRIGRWKKEPSSFNFPGRYSSSTEHYRNSMATAEEWSDRETRQEILQHLKEINNIIERKRSLNSSSCQMRIESDGVVRVGENPRRRPSGRIIPMRSSSSKPSNCNKSEVLSSGSKVYWAITKVTKYPDNCKTYEIMKLSRKKPRNVPSTSETVFVLVPK